MMTLADMTTGDGKRFIDNIIWVENSREENSKFEWSTEQPCAADKRVWRSVLMILTNNGFTISPQLVKFVICVRLIIFGRCKNG